MSPREVASCFACLALLAGCCTGTLDAGNPVKVSILSILATDSDDTVDAKLECLAREVRKVEPRLTGFHLARQTCKSVAVGDKETFELADGQVATIVIDRWVGDDKQERVQLKITPPLMGEITYASACGKFLPILTRHRTANNEQLILAVRVQHCSGKGR